MAGTGLCGMLSISPWKVRRWWAGLTARQPRLFAHWAWMTDFRYSL